MKETMWMYVFIALGVFTIVIMMLIQDLTTTAEEDFYLSKEIMEAALVDSVDLGVYRETGDIRIIEAKFVENFTRRFAESVNNSKNYTLEFYEIYECPPKATVLIKTNSRSVKVSTDDISYDIVTIISGILEDKIRSGSWETD